MLCFIDEMMSRTKRKLECGSSSESVLQEVCLSVTSISSLHGSLLEPHVSNRGERAICVELLRKAVIRVACSLWPF